MEDLASAFSRLPSFSPMMMVNTSETCATRRLCQCTSLGISMNDVTRKFYGDPEDATDLSTQEYYARRAVIEEVAKWSDKMENEPELIFENRWAPILYRYEIVKSSAKRERDWGHLIFTDMTLTRFLLVMVFPSTCDCGNLSHHDYDALTKYHADRFMCLLTYLHHDWKQPEPYWVRATYTTPAHELKLNPDFLDKLSDPESTPKTTKPSIFHVNADKFKPTLLPSELEKIDNMVAQGGKTKRTEPSSRDKVLGTKEDRPDVSGAWKHKNPRQCAYCEEIKEKDLQKCSRCKLVYYCGRECQRMAWPSHKHFCKAA